MTLIGTSTLARLRGLGVTRSRGVRLAPRPRDFETASAARDAPPIPDRIEDLYRPGAAVVGPEVGQERAGVASEHHDLVARRIVRHASVFARRRNRRRMELRPRASIPLPHIVDVGLHFGR